MTRALLVFIIGWCALAAAGDVAYKQWSITMSRPLWLLSLGSVFYMGDTFLWAAALVRGLPMARGSVLMCMLSTLTGVAIGRLYGEALSPKNVFGVVLAMAAIACLD